jgi:hypothetical protein
MSSNNTKKKEPVKEKDTSRRVSKTSQATTNPLQCLLQRVLFNEKHLVRLEQMEQSIWLRSTPGSLVHSDKSTNQQEQKQAIDKNEIQVVEDLVIVKILMCSKNKRAIYDYFQMIQLVLFHHKIIVKVV